VKGGNLAAISVSTILPASVSHLPVRVAAIAHAAADLLAQWCAADLAAPRLALGVL
jgi:hypothetical protein